MARERPEKSAVFRDLHGRRRVFRDYQSRCITVSTELGNDAGYLQVGASDFAVGSRFCSSGAGIL